DGGIERGLQAGAGVTGAREIERRAERRHDRDQREREWHHDRGFGLADEPFGQLRELKNIADRHRELPLSETARSLQGRFFRFASAGVSINGNTKLNLPKARHKLNASDRIRPRGVMIRRAAAKRTIKF